MDATRGKWDHVIQGCALEVWIHQSLVDLPVTYATSPAVASAYFIAIDVLGFEPPDLGATALRLDQLRFSIMFRVSSMLSPVHAIRGSLVPVVGRA